jgi:hypothetical protein
LLCLTYNNNSVFNIGTNDQSYCKLESFSGVAPPNQRNESQFDAGSKFHVAANAGYVEVKTLDLLNK